MKRKGFFSVAGCLLLLFGALSVNGQSVQKEYRRALKQLEVSADSARVMDLAERSLTVAGDLLPVKDLTRQTIYYFRFDGALPSFEKYLRKYAPVKTLARVELKDVAQQDVLIVGVRDFTQARKALSEADFPGRVVLAVFDAKTSRAEKLAGEKSASLVCAPSVSHFSQVAAAEAIFGGIPVGDTPAIRLAYGYAEQVGMSADTLDKIDALLREVVESGAAPGVHVLVGRHGRVVYDRWYGTTMGAMDGSEKVQGDMIYDMASVTKVMATLPFVMKLYDEGKIRLDDRLGDVMPVFRGTNKENMILADILTHRAGLKAWIPYYLQTIDSLTRPLPQYYRVTPDSVFTQEVVPGMYAIGSIKDTIQRQIILSPVKDDKKYVYSDFAFFIFRQMVEQFYGQPLDSLVQTELYRPMGAWRSGYNPLKRFSISEIVPSENDTYWRHTIVRGYVHDMAAAFLDGVSGHAGLFSTADDMAKMCQMYLNGGTYGGKRYIEDSTVRLFSSCYYCDEGNYRGLGFDRPSFSNKVMGPKTFGHTGFTGTAVWIDPEADMIYVFLSNRTFESMNNNRLSSGNFRSRIQQTCYDAITDDAK